MDGIKRNIKYGMKYLTKAYLIALLVALIVGIVISTFIPRDVSYLTSVWAFFLSIIIVFLFFETSIHPATALNDEVPVGLKIATTRSEVSISQIVLDSIRIIVASILVYVLGSTYNKANIGSLSEFTSAGFLYKIVALNNLSEIVFQLMFNVAIVIFASLIANRFNFSSVAAAFITYFLLQAMSVYEYIIDLSFGKIIIIGLLILAFFTRHIVFNKIDFENK